MGEQMDFISPAKYWHCSILVHDIPQEVKCEDIIIHFQRRRTGGDDVKHVLYPYNGPGTALIVFEDENAVQSVMQHEHRLSGRLVLVQPMKPQVFSRVTVVLESHMSRNPSIRKALEDLSKECSIICVSNTEKGKVVITGTWDQMKKVNELFESLYSHSHSENPDIEPLSGHQFDDGRVVAEGDNVEEDIYGQSGHSTRKTHDELHDRRMLAEAKGTLEVLKISENEKHSKRKTSYLKSRSQAEVAEEDQGDRKEYEGACSIASNGQHSERQSLPYIPCGAYDHSSYANSEQTATHSISEDGVKQKNYDYNLEAGMPRKYDDGRIGNADRAHQSSRYRQDAAPQSLPPIPLSNDVKMGSGRNSRASFEDTSDRAMTHIQYLEDGIGEKQKERKVTQYVNEDKNRDMQYGYKINDASFSQYRSVQHDDKSDHYSEERRGLASFNQNRKARGKYTLEDDRTEKTHTHLPTSTSDRALTHIQYPKDGIGDKQKERKVTEYVNEDKNRDAVNSGSASAQAEINIKDYKPQPPKENFPDIHAPYGNDVEMMETDEEEITLATDDPQHANGKANVPFSERISVNRDNFATMERLFSAKLKYIKDEKDVYYSAEKSRDSNELSICFISLNETDLNICKEEIIEMYQAVVYDEKAENTISIKKKKVPTATLR